MATATKKRPSKNGKPRPKRARQQHLPGLEPPSHPELDRLAEAYVEARDERMEHGRTEVKKRDLLEAKMREFNLPAYETATGLVCEFKNKSKLTVKKKGSEPEPSDDDFDPKGE